jgi:uncharacterized protein (DUF1800 family)
MPPEALSFIAALPVSSAYPQDLAEQVKAARRAAFAMSADEKKDAAKQLRREFARLDFQVFERRTVRALLSPHQLQEMLTWFWFNHFNVFQNKKQVRFLLSDFEERAIRPHVLGRFRDLLRAVLMHPAMLVYLDNAENAKDAVNENYARELMELHTLGVNGGYTQGDVQALARILTGAGIDLSGRPDGSRGSYFKQGLFARSISSAGIPRRRNSSRASSRCTFSPTIRRRTCSTAWRRRSGRPTATSARR